MSEIKRIVSGGVRNLNYLGENASNLYQATKKSLQSKKEIQDLGDSFKKANINKNTFIGAGLITAGFLLSIECIKDIKKTIDKIKKD